MRPSESQQTTATKLKRIAWLSARDPEKLYHCLMHHFNEGSLAECFNELEGRKAVGTEGVSKEMYGKELHTNIKELVNRMQTMSYRPAPVK